MTKLPAGLQFIGIFFVILLSVSFIFGQGHSEKVDELLSMLSDQGQFSGAVLIAENGKITLKKGYGPANRQTNQPIDENTIFELASVSKQFTAIGIVILKERGKLSYEDKVTKYFPELEEFKSVTIRNLLNHTSGIPDYVNSNAFSSIDKSKINGNKEIIEFLAKNRLKLLFEPNTKYEYSNTGYVLLASIIEKISGQSFAKFLEKSIFKPLKMNRTFVYNRRLKPRKIDNYAWGYGFSKEKEKFILPDDEVKYVIFLDGIVGDKNISSTVMDLFKWDQALRHGKLITKEGLNEVYTPPVLPEKPSAAYGFGWYVEKNKDYGEIVQHSGSLPGYKTYFERHLTNNKTIILLQNFHDVVLPRRNIREILYDKSLTKIYRKQITVNPGILAKYAGEYRDKTDERSIITIAKGNNWVGYNSAKNKGLRLYPESETSFFTKENGPVTQIEFATAANGDRIIRLIDDGKVVEEGVKIK